MKFRLFEISIAGTLGLVSALASCSAQSGSVEGESVESVKNETSPSVEECEAVLAGSEGRVETDSSLVEECKEQQLHANRSTNRNEVTDVVLAPTPESHF